MASVKTNLTLPACSHRFGKCYFFLGKKGKKTKGKTLALTDFLQETTGSLPVQPIRKSNINWADEVEDYDGYDSRKPVNVVLPTAPKASRDYEDISDKVPKDPPYIAYLSNLPYDVDEDEIALFFKNMKISNMRIPKDDRDVSKLKGFGYVEFEDRDSLLNALVIPDTTLKSRRIRIEVAANSENDRRRGRMDMGRERGDRSESSFGDWRSGPRSETSDSDRRGGFNRDREGGFNRDNMRGGEREDRSFNRDNMRGGEREDRTFSRDNMRDRDSGFNRDRDNKEGFNRRERDGLDDRPGGWRDQERGGFTRERGNFRDSDRGGRFEDRDERRGDRDERRGFGAEPRERPKLVLAPRTKPVENVPVKAESVPSASIFGSAKPVDTSQREREIEEKIAKEQSDKSRDDSKDRKTTYLSDESDKKNIERSRPSRKIDDSPKRNCKERHEKEMPKFSEPEPPNFAANNKFAFLETEDNSD
ncbi:hypothetical protein NQ314_013440 [Rhamnusium bicolor]|uniref:RRM domain-containing protein n=1 Tax=Rhamnusium bicolor TaxID=1586634 RepID=A0AAV8X781_9CUCU|nr:hypothetical protein NQ314_013440 [Rhamnusium bicolor]